MEKEQLAVENERDIFHAGRSPGGARTNGVSLQGFYTAFRVPHYLV